MSNPKTQRKIIKLEYPVRLADRTLTQVSMRRATVGDMLACPIRDAGDVAGEVALMARLCDLVPEELQDLDWSDYERLQRELLSFRGGKKPAATGVDAQRASADAAGADGLAGSADAAR